MAMLPPPHHPDEHLMHARTQRKLQDAKGSRRVSTGDVVLLSVLALAATAVIALVVLVLF